MLDFQLTLGLGALGTALYACYRVGVLWINHREEANNAALTEIPPSPELYLRVSPGMSADLVLLELDLAIGAQISAEHLNQAIKRAYLRSHPDKGGSVELFIQVKDAVERLQAQLKDRLQPEYSAYFNSSEKQFISCLTLAESWELVAKQEQELAVEWQRFCNGLQKFFLSALVSSAQQGRYNATYRAQQCGLCTLSSEELAKEQIDLEQAQFSASVSQESLCIRSMANNFPVTLNYMAQKVESLYPSIAVNKSALQAVHSYQNSTSPGFFNTSTVLIAYTEPSNDDAVESNVLITHNSYGSCQ